MGLLGKKLTSPGWEGDAAAGTLVQAPRDRAGLGRCFNADFCYNQKENVTATNAASTESLSRHVAIQHPVFCFPGGHEPTKSRRIRKLSWVLGPEPVWMAFGRTAPTAQLRQQAASQRAG